LGLGVKQNLKVFLATDDWGLVTWDYYHALNSQLHFPSLMNPKNTYPLIDIGANLSHESFSGDLEEVLDAAKQAGIVTILVTGTSVTTSKEATALARQYPHFLYSTAGIHPHDASHFDPSALRELATLAADDCVKAMGETGLDYCRDFSPRERQREAFAAQLQQAAELEMPVFLHQRDGHEDFIKLLRQYRNALPRAVVHCFTGTETELRDYLDLDMHIGITGWICDERRGRHLHDIIKLIPANRLMLETDSPYLLPRTITPKPSTRRNEPANLVHVLESVASCLGKSGKTVAEQTTETARDFFAV
jgi:TatD DNase family protein